MDPSDFFLTGATGSGKTAVGIALAERLDAEIISMDSMAVYRGMDVGTAKPDRQQRARIPHHLIDVVGPDEDFSLARYVEAAQAAAAEIRGRGKRVLFVGGTPLYLKGLLRGIFAGPGADSQLREELEEWARREGAAALHQRLASVDPAAAARLHPNDTRRLVRALEVYTRTGRPISDWQQQFGRGSRAADRRVYVLDWPRADLARRIGERVDAMFAQGLVEEVRRLLDQPAGLSRTAAAAVGYREVIEHLRDQRGLAETVELVKVHTRQLAKRQGTWFRSLSECTWIAMEDGPAVEAVVERIVRNGP